MMATMRYDRIIADQPEDLMVQAAAFVQKYRTDPYHPAIMTMNNKLKYVKSVCSHVFGDNGEVVFEDAVTYYIYGEDEFYEFICELNPWYSDAVVQVFRMTFPTAKVEGDIHVTNVRDT